MSKCVNMQMSNKVKITWNQNAEEMIKQAALEQAKKNGIDLNCPHCSRPIHLSFSGDTCQFCGTVIEYCIDSKV